MLNIPNSIKNFVLRSTFFRVSEKSSLMKYDSDQELRMKCKKYSERNSLLEEVLFELNKKNLSTSMSCKGHTDYCGYVGFKVPTEEEALVNSLCTRLLAECPTSIYIHEGKTNFRGISVAVYFTPEDRKEVLSVLLDSIRNPKDIKSEYMSEVFRLCHIQEAIHDDLIYGFQLYPTNDGAFIISPGYKFMYFSLERRISLAQLSKVCMHLDTFSKEVIGKEFKEEVFTNILKRLNNQLEKDIENPSIVPVDYYESLREEEIINMMEDMGFSPGYLADLISRNQARKIKKEEISFIGRFNLEEGLYLLLLKLEESLAVKRQNALQEGKYML